MELVCLAFLHLFLTSDHTISTVYILRNFRIISLLPFPLATDVTDVTLGAGGLWLGTRTGAGGTVTLG